MWGAGGATAGADLGDSYLLALALIVPTEVFMAQPIVPNLDPQIPRALLTEPTRPLKEMLLAMPDVGDDTDFERASDVGREVVTNHRSEPCSR